MLGGDIPAVDPVKGREHVAAPEQLRLPRLVTWHVSACMNRLDAHHPRTEGAQRKSVEHACLGALDIDRHEVNLVGTQVLLEDGIKPPCLHRDRNRLKSALNRRLGLAGVERAEPGARHRIEGARAVGIAGSALDDGVAGPERAEVLGQLRVCLDEQPPPAEVVQARGD